MNHSMNKVISFRVMKITYYVIAISLVFVHVGLFTLFFLNDVTPMACFNILSIAFYVFSVLLVYREKFRAFAVAVYLEIAIHMGLATYFVGWECGFQTTLIGIFIALFFAEYVGRSLQIPYARALPLGVLGMLSTLGVYVLGVFVPPPYSLPPVAVHVLQLLWNVLVFGIGMFCLWTFVRLTFESETLLSSEATHDALTGLPNRYRMSERLKRQAGEEDASACWLAIIDIDDFKVINDTYGHNCGDEVLKALAGILRTFYEEDDVCRWGGEEFLVVGRYEDGACAAREQLERLRAAVEKHGFWHHDVRLRLTATIGAAACMPGQSAIEWVNEADGRLYYGKNNGKNQVVL